MTLAISYRYKGGKMQRKLIFLLFIVLFIVLSCDEMTTDADYIVPDAKAPLWGDGNADNPYEIGTLGNLFWINQNEEEWDKHYIQTADIDASETADWAWGGWIPIGNSNHRFRGHYDGDNHVIDGLHINYPSVDHDNLGFFGYIDNAVIKNLGIENVSISGRNNVGAFAGYSTGSEIYNCYSSGSINGFISLGGILGFIRNSSIENCYSTAEVVGKSLVGGLIGHSNALSVVSDSYSSGNVSGVTHVGGLIGMNRGSHLEFSYSAATITPQDTLSTAGGLVGVNVSGATIINCYSTSTISGNTMIGGLVGLNQINATVSDCYSTGEVSGDSYIGGLVGGSRATSTITNSYSIGMVSGKKETGGLVSIQEDFSTTENSFWDEETSGQTTSAGGAGKTTAEMKDINTYLDVGWDFVQIWTIDDYFHDGYPYLQWQR